MKLSLTGNTAQRLLGRLAIANGVSVGLELPESLGVVDLGVGDLTLILGLVGVAKVIHSWATVLESGSKEGLAKLTLDSVKEGGLRLRLNRVDRAESKAHQTVARFLLELRADLGSSLNSLLLSSQSANGNMVLVDITTSRAAITVADLPASTWELGSRAGWLVDGVVARISTELAREKPSCITNQ